MNFLDGKSNPTPFKFTPKYSEYSFYASLYARVEHFHCILDGIDIILNNTDCLNDRFHLPRQQAIYAAKAASHILGQFSDTKSYF